MVRNMLPRWRHILLLFICVLLVASISDAKRPKKRRRSLSRRPRVLTGSSLINLQFVKARMAEIGFSYVQGAEKFLVQANEWVNNKYVQSVPTDRQILRGHARSAMLRNLIPGREYIIQVFPQTGNGRPVGGGAARKIVRTSQRCYICNGKKSNEACIGAKNSMECPHDKDACLNEVRYSKGVPAVMKRCAQWRPELGKQIQNGQDMTTACSGRENLKDAACRCMCRSDLCNEAEMPCVDECFKELPIPDYATLRCSNESKVGSICRWSCYRGFKIKGLRESQCRKDRTWSLLSPPECIGDVLRNPIATCPMLKPEEPMDMYCTDDFKFKVGSTCTFSCPRAFYLDGDATRTCDAKGKWSGEMPKCVEIVCPKIIADEELTHACSNGVKIGSVCEFACPEGRKFVGKEVLTCMPGGKWSAPFPRCTDLDCGAPPKTFPHVVMECGDIPKRRTGKVCNFACENGYQLAGAKQSFCYSGNSWTSTSPSCRRIICRPEMIPPAFGFVRCSDRSFHSSECKFSCKEGYMLQGATSTTCQNNAKWTTVDVPVCKKILCPRIRFNGVVSCNDAQNLGSVCMFSCKRGYGFPPETKTKLKCLEMDEEEMDLKGGKSLSGRWDGPIPKCILVGCPKLGSLPAHSTMKCTGRMPATPGTSCFYSCEPGYRLEGSRKTTCIGRSDGTSIADWSSAPPECIRTECEMLQELAYGFVKCTDDFYAGSKCTLNCEYGRFLTGKKIMKCDEEGKWSAKMPICKLVTCIASPGLMNGRFDCGDADRLPFNYECEASCSVGYELSTPGVATCGIAGEWLISEDLQCLDRNECEELDEHERPTNGECDQICVNTVGSYKCRCREGYRLSQDGKSCIVTICPTLEVGLRGRVSCLNKNKVGSLCTLECVPGFEASTGKKVTCQEDGTWNKKIGKCTRVSCQDLEIPPYGSMECTQGFKFGSTCEFACSVGYQMEGKSETSCGADKKWTSDAPVCTRKECDPSFQTLEFAVVTCTDDNKYESMCVAKCLDGYEIRQRGEAVNVVKLHCEEDATWSAQKPKCVKKRCNPYVEDLMLARPNSLLSCTDGDWFGSTCKLACDEGYTIEGDFRVKCSGDAEWNKILGHCEKIQCPPLTVPKHGEVYCDEEMYYQSTCMFYCKEGYELNGKSQTKCTSDRTWTNKPPTCDRIMCPPVFTKLLKGTATCSEEAYFGSTCEYKCDPGYEFVDTKTSVRKQYGLGLNEAMTFDIMELVCQSSGLWSGGEERPVCAKHECIPPSSVLRQANPDGKLKCSDGDRFESVCELTCNRGYEVVDGRASTQCKDDRSWGPRLGHCERIRCPMFEPLINGAVKCSNANFYQSRCLFGCYPGYKLNGSPVSFCQWDGTFSHAPPFCEKKVCPKTHMELPNGTATCTDGARYASECTYVCDPGYEMVFKKGVVSEDEDNVVLKCLADGTWEGKLPFCRRKQCSIHDGALAKARLNGEVTCTESYWSGSVCSVTCNEGFKLNGSPKTRCTANADWEPPIGFCERRECPRMKAPSDGSIECTNENKFESVCNFKCKYGFELVGFKESKCLARMYFSAKPPVCNEIICSANFLRLKDGKVECTNKNKQDSKCHYSCDVGHQLTDESADVLTCLDTYSWSDDKPVCEKKVCPKEDARLMKASEHGTVTCSDANKYLSTCSVKCHPGYKLTEGGAFTTCKASQEWGPTLGYCTKIMCEELEPLENGVVDCTDSLRFESVCSFKCDPGFELTHDKPTTCQADGTFDVKPPTCKKVDCPSTHMRIHNGKVYCSEGNAFGSVCKYECNAGFERVTGSASAQCLADRTWDADKTGCERVQCDLDDILIVKARENGDVTCTSSNFYGSVCSVECDKGYELTGLATGTTHCNEFARWDGELGYCSRVVCDEHEQPANGTLKCTDENRYESKCSFTCDEGFKMEGVDKSTCQADRSWTTDAPTCNKVTCSTSNLFLEHGTANCSDENKYKSVCWYSCDAGYEMEEDIPNSMCLASRAWTYNKPTCVKKECDLSDPRILQAVENGQLSCTDGARYESVCTLGCDEGYELAGKGKIECLATALWNKDIGTCERISCRPLSLKPNSRMECSNTDRYESICMFKCDEGYQMRGAPQSVCQANGRFDRGAPNCIKTKCTPDYKEFAFGTFDCSEENYFQSVCKYTCDEGYRMMSDGPEVVVSECLASQTWSLEVPICEKKICPYDEPHLLKAIEHGDLVCTEENRYGSKCRLVCNEGYELKGAGTTECTKESTWSNELESCTKIVCPKLPIPKAAIVSCTDQFNFNSTCTSTCEGGHTFHKKTHVVDGVVTVTCTASGKWTTPGSLPRCIKEACPKEYLRFRDGEVNCTDRFYYKSQCMFKCDVGYELVDPRDDFDVTTILLTCQADATWDSVEKAPLCQRVMCPDMVLDETTTHGKIKCSRGSSYESECNLDCHRGYRVFDGATKTTCLGDKTWEPPLGKCEKISCKPISAPKYSKLTCTDDYRFKSQCRVICIPGFQIYDPEGDYDPEVGLECKADGNWCGDAPPCTRVTCPAEFLSLAGGNARCTNDNLFESRCKYSCNPGYQMIQGEKPMTTCTTHKTWSNPQPTCEKKRCPANETSIKEAQVNGHVSCSEENKFDSRCQLECFTGYELSGEPNTTCMHNGEWSNGIGLCNKVECEPAAAPKNAVMKCTDGHRYESLCTFACKTGYMLTEVSVKEGNGIVCQADREWVGAVIECEKITCPAKGYDSLENGKVTCNDTNYFTSRCLFECNWGYELTAKIQEDDERSGTVMCTDRGYWDVPTPPECAPVHCGPTETELNAKLVNGQVDCSKGSEFRSQCRARCNPGFELVNGKQRTVCGSDKNWGPVLGICQKIQCEDIKPPANAKIVCDDDFRFGSQCLFECEPGFQKVIRGKTRGVMTCRADGAWEGSQPTCQRIRCDNSYLNLDNGEVVCTNRNMYESQCEYTCERGYELAGSKSARCQVDGTWSSPLPVCEVKTCKSEYAANGHMNCTGSEYNAVCELTCDEGHILVNGAKFSTCTDAKTGWKQAVWTPPLGDCEKTRCPLIPEIANGNARCSDSNKYRSVCYVECRHGFEVKGVFFSTTCQSDGTWSRAFQTCERVTCDPTYLDVTYGSVSATDSNYYGSILKYNCPNLGHKFTGTSSKVTCLVSGKWSVPKPKCERFTCPPLTLPNGRLECTGKQYNDFGSVCNHVCNENYERQGRPKTECRLDGTWSAPQAYCKGHCDLKFDNFQNGVVECTNSHYHHSRCTFRCNSPSGTSTSDIKYNLFGDAFLTCKKDGRWDGMPPCCAQNCPPHGKMDLFFAFDQSSSVGFRNWEKIKEFVNMILQSFHIGEDNVLAGALRYNRDVDSRNEIPIGKHTTWAELQHAIRFMPYGGYGTSTGKALRHLAEYSLHQPGNRPDVADIVILFTDGASQDDVKGPADLLKANNATIHVVGLQGKTQLNFKQLSEIASPPLGKHISIIRDAFERLTDALGGRVGEKVCDNPCLLSNEYRERAESYIQRHANDIDSELKKSALLM